MRIITTLLIMLSFPAYAWTPIPQPAVCDKTQQLLDEMIEDGFLPAITSKINTDNVVKTLIIWINDKNEVLVTTSITVNNINVSCIVALGDTDTKMYPRKK